MDTDTTFQTNNRQERRGGLRSTSWKPGESGNPNGRPRDDESWSGIIRQIGNMTPDEILEWLPSNNPLGQDFAQYPRKVQMKWLLVLRVFASQMFDPNGVMFRELLDRMEGRVPLRAEFDAKLSVDGLQAMVDAVYGAVVDAVEVPELEDGDE